MIFQSFKQLPFRQADFLFPLRIGTACLTALAYYFLADDVRLFYALDGIVDYPLLDIKKDSLLPSIQAIEKAINKESFHHGLTILYYALTACMAIGFATPFATAMLLVLHASIFTVIPSYSYGFDYFCQISLFYCLVFPTYRSVSIDKHLWNLKPSASKKLYLCQRVLQVHLSIVYFFNGLHKAFGSSWWNGEALWKAIHLPYFNSSRWDFSFLPSWLLTIAGILVVVIEATYPLNLFFKRLNKPFISGIIMLHILISIFLGLTLFSFTMIMLYYCAWLHLTRKYTNPDC